VKGSKKWRRERKGRKKERKKTRARKEWRIFTRGSENGTGSLGMLTVDFFPG